MTPQSKTNSCLLSISTSYNCLRVRPLLRLAPLSPVGRRPWRGKPRSAGGRPPRGRGPIGGGPAAPGTPPSGPATHVPPATARGIARRRTISSDDSTTPGRSARNIESRGCRAPWRHPVLRSMGRRPRIPRTPPRCRPTAGGVRPPRPSGHRMAPLRMGEMGVPQSPPVDHLMFIRLAHD